VSIGFQSGMSFAIALAHADGNRSVTAPAVGVAANAAISESTGSRSAFTPRSS